MNMRVAKKYIVADYHHVMVQGIVKEKIFKDISEINFYKKLLYKYKFNFNVKIISYCFMSNHLHLILFSNEIENISKFMHSVNTDFAVCYNNKYQRVRICI